MLKSLNLSLSEVCLLPAVNSGGGQMRSADRGNTEAGGGKQPPHNTGNSIFAPKIFCPREKMQIIEVGRREGHRSTIPLMYFIHSQQDATS